MSILVFGKTGQVATELRRQANVTALGRDHADLSDPTACAAAINAHKPSVVINAAAYTAVDKAEGDADLAHLVNALAPGVMAQACADLNIPFLHISTDYVFDGSGDQMRKPDDATDPLGIYGTTKLAGERLVQAAGGCHAILRTSWVFSAHGANFVKTMLRLSETRDHLTVVNNQIGGPTPAAGIANALLTMAQQLQAGQGGGIYHYAGMPATSWECFARETFAQAGRNITVQGIPTSDYPTPAPRPLNSRLDCTTLTRDFGITPPDWKHALTDVLKELKA